MYPVAAFEVPTAFWDVTPLSPVNFNRRLGETSINFYRHIRRHIPEGNVLQRIFFVRIHLSCLVGYSSAELNNHNGDFLFFKAPDNIHAYIYTYQQRQIRTAIS